MPLGDVVTSTPAGREYKHHLLVMRLLVNKVQGDHGISAADYLGVPGMPGRYPAIAVLVVNVGKAQGGKTRCGFCPASVRLVLWVGCSRLPSSWVARGRRFAGWAKENGPLCSRRAGLRRKWRLNYQGPAT